MAVEAPERAGSVPVEMTDAGQVVPLPGLGRRGLAAPAWTRAVLRNRKAAFGLIILVLFAVVAVMAPVIAPGDPTDFVARPHQPPSAEHIFGTTGTGQDVFAQTVWGSRTTLAVGILVGVSTTVVGIIVGLSAGYFGGLADDVLSLMTNVFLIVPSLPLLVVLAAFIGSGNALYFVLVLTATGWAWPARVMRSQTLSLREKDFVAAAKVGGESGPRIILAEILPNMLSIVVASFLGSTIFAIGALAALEFLGLGNPSAVTWGTNLYWASNNAGLLTGAWWTFVPSGACIALVAFAFALVNYAIDEITNPRLRAQKETTGLVKRLASGASTRATPVVRHAG
ncbi:MAG: ABC transporter permease [Thermomicrobiales bacterium]